MAAFIRDRNARHEFRNKYKIKSKFRKLRDDNRRLFKENKEILHQVSAIYEKTLRYFYKYNNLRICGCKNFYSEVSTEKYKRLISGLDDESIECVSKILSRVQLISNLPLCPDRNETRLIDIFSCHEKELLHKIQYDFKNEILQLEDGNFAYRKYILPIKHFEVSVFYYRHHMNILSNVTNLTNKDFIDVGGYIGDSGLIFSEYTKGKIYSFEAVSTNFQNMLKTIELNDIKNIVPVNLALGSKEDAMEINIRGGASTFNKKSIGYRENLKNEVVSITTLDNFLNNKDIDIGLIKVDIEGFEQEFLMGAEQTIKKYKPTLLLSIYHNSSDFFGIKPIIESWNLGYKFKIIHPISENFLLETLLICEHG